MLEELFMKVNQLLHASQSAVFNVEIRVFHTRNPFSPGEQFVSSEELEADQHAIDLSEWQPVLKEYGWSFEYPPRISLIYSDDILYLAAECPESLLAEDDESVVTDYCRTVASLIFTHTNISQLPVCEEYDVRILPAIRNTGHVIDECGVIFIKEQVMAYLKSLSIDAISDFLDEFNKANYTQDQIELISEENRFIFLMEMLNRNGLNIVFLRQVLPKIIHQDLSEQSDAAIFALRDHLTRDYMDYMDSIHLDTMAHQLIQHIDEVLGADVKPGATYLYKLLTLSISLAKADTQRLGNVLVWPIVTKEHDRQILGRELLKRVYARILEHAPAQIESNDCLMQTSQILQAKHQELLTVVKLMAERFAAEARLHKPATFSFFADKHEGLMNAFVRELSALKTAQVSTEQLKFRLLDVLHRFRDQFASGRSKRAMELFNALMDGHFPNPVLQNNLDLTP